MRKAGFIIVAVFVLAGIFPLHGALSADETPNTPTRHVKIEPVPELSDIRRVSASQTHSGLPVPRYVALKYSRVNARKGPSTRHPILWQYQRQGLPLVVVAEMDIWRKVRDVNGDESWIRTPQLTGERHAISLGEATLHAKPSVTSKPVAILAPHTILKLDDCATPNWCRIRASGKKGWIQRDLVWGDDPI